MSTIPGYLTVDEVAARLKLEHSQVCKFIRKGEIKGSKVGNQWLVKTSDIAGYKKRPRGNPNFKRSA